MRTGGVVPCHREATGHDGTERAEINDPSPQWAYSAGRSSITAAMAGNIST